MDKIYKLIKANKTDLVFVKQAKLTTIFDYAKNISEEEYENILGYVDRFMQKFLSDYKIIVKDGVKCGVVLIREFEDGYLLDEIYLLPEYRNLGIGSDIIKKAIKKYNKIYLWVYKENLNAIRLYNRLGFFIKEEKESRFLMVCKN